MISVRSVMVVKDTGKVTVNIRVLNNPGILGAVLKVSVDDTVFFFQEGSKNGYPGLILTAPGPAAVSSPYTFMQDATEHSDKDWRDGTLLAIVPLAQWLPAEAIALPLNTASYDASYKPGDVTGDGKLFRTNLLHH